MKRDALRNLTVDVISDVICPWCYIGKRRLEKAVRASGRSHEVQVPWHPFQLNPQMPKEGMDRRKYRTAKFGSWERSQALDLIWLAGKKGVQDAVAEAQQGSQRCFCS